MKKLFIVFAAAFMFMACSGPLDKKFNSETLEQDLALLEPELSDEEKELLAGVIIYHAIQGDSIDGRSYKSLLEEGKKMKEEDEKQTQQTAEKTVEDTVADTTAAE